PFTSDHLKEIRQGIQNFQQNVGERDAHEEFAAASRVLQFVPDKTSEIVSGVGGRGQTGVYTSHQFLSPTDQLQIAYVDDSRSRTHEAQKAFLTPSASSSTSATTKTAEATEVKNEELAVLRAEEEEDVVIGTDPKTYLSNERTFFRYLHIAVLLSVTSVLLLQTSPKPGAAPTGGNIFQDLFGGFTPERFATRVCSYLLAALALFVVLFLFESRLTILGRTGDKSLLVTAGGTVSAKSGGGDIDVKHTAYGAKTAVGPEIVPAALFLGFFTCLGVHLVDDLPRFLES
ncbi:unnamed protein product, partial [Amoebophrya sp. A25]